MKVDYIQTLWKILDPSLVKGFVVKPSYWLELCLCQLIVLFVTQCNMSQTPSSILCLCIINAGVFDLQHRTKFIKE